MEKIVNINFEQIELIINIDGLPLTRSSTNALWPILGNIYGLSNVFIIGAYVGPQKPQDSNLFLSDFVAECVELVNNGLCINTKNIPFSLKGIICDVPAKSFVLGIKGHNGYSSCTKCLISGVFLNNRVCFPGNNFHNRTDNGFRANSDEEYHVHETIIKNIPNFDIVKGVPLDYMHLLCLGITKKLLFLWVGGDLSFRLRSSHVKAISQKIELLKHHIPKEFVRKPRSLE